MRGFEIDELDTRFIKGPKAWSYMYLGRARKPVGVALSPAIGARTAPAAVAHTWRVCAPDPPHHDRPRVGRRPGRGRVPRAEPGDRGFHPLLDARAGGARRRLVLPRHPRPGAAVHRCRRADERDPVGGVRRRVRGRVPARVRTDRARRRARRACRGHAARTASRSPTRSTTSKSSDRREASTVSVSRRVRIVAGPRGRGGPSRGWLLRGRRRSRRACR